MLHIGVPCCEGAYQPKPIKQEAAAQTKPTVADKPRTSEPKSKPVKGK